MVLTDDGILVSPKRKEILAHTTTWMVLEDTSYVKEVKDKKANTIYDFTCIRHLQGSNSQGQSVE